MLKIALLLKPGWRSSEGVARVTDAASALGIEITGASKVAVSGRIAPERFESLFGVEPIEVAALPADDFDFGAPPGHASADLEVPVSLRDLVESITVTPPARRLFSKH